MARSNPNRTKSQFPDKLGAIELEEQSDKVVFSSQSPDKSGARKAPDVVVLTTEEVSIP